jgi:hypothetical protein
VKRRKRIECEEFNVKRNKRTKAKKCEEKEIIISILSVNSVSLRTSFIMNLFGVNSSGFPLNE